MTCGGGCCGGNPPSIIATPDVPAPQITDQEPTRDDQPRCCSESDVEADTCCDESCLRSVAAQECMKTCAPTAENVVNDADACCNPGNMKTPATDDCKKSAKQCCSRKLENVPVQGDSCCEGAMSGFAVSQKCKASDEGSEGNRSYLKDILAEPCPSHLEATRRRYSNVFGTMSCMCKALLVQGLESCCATKRKLSAERLKSPRIRERDNLRKRTAANTAQPRSSYKSGSAAEPENDSGCCTTTQGANDQCVGKNSPACQPRATCASPKPEIGKGPIQNTNELDGCNAALDPEKGNDSISHVMLSVQGMTCTGCETKLQRSIKTIPSATNVQASIVLSRAEFDISPSVTTVEQAIAQLERATGFVLSKLSTTGHELRVRETANSKRILEAKLPIGVLDIKRQNEATISISYDANLVGARNLLEQSFGIRLELAPFSLPDSIVAGAKHVRHVCYMTCLSTAMTIPVLVFAWAPLPPNETAYQSASLALATILQVVVVGPFYDSALRSLVFSRVIEMDLLIVLSTSAAYIFSVVAYGYMMAGKPLISGEFFESSTLLITLIMIGRCVSAFARQKAVESISMSSLQPMMAILVNNEADSPKEIDSRTLHYGDIFLVKPDSRIVTDGTICSGESEVDESMITGESTLVPQEVGSSVIAGSVNSAGLLHVRVTRLPGENTISSINDMVDQAKLSKPRVQELADQIAGHFVPVVVAITLVVLCIWIAVGIRIQHHTGSDAAINALTYAIAVLIVSCPCAVGLAVPMVIVIACGVGAQHGVVFKSAQSIECCWRATHVVFDKTGTLTQGQASVVIEYSLGTLDDEALSLLLALVSGNKHPNSVALFNHLTQRGVPEIRLDSLKTLVGKGVEGHQGSSILRAGSAKWLGLQHLDAVRSFQSKGLTTVCFVINNEPQMVFGLSDTLRPEAKTIVSKLIARGVDVSIVSGDSSGAVRSVGLELGLPESKLKAECSPQDKKRYVETLTKAQKAVVLFCGDGSNDAGALAQATVGIHTSEGTDVARSASDAVLMRPELSGILKLMEISHAAYRRIVLNFCWAGIYNLFAILLAAGAFIDFRIPPQYAGLGELVSVLPVILIALQMKWIRFEEQE